MLHCYVKIIDGVIINCQIMFQEMGHYSRIRDVSEDMHIDLVHHSVFT